MKNIFAYGIILIFATFLIASLSGEPIQKPISLKQECKNYESPEMSEFEICKLKSKSVASMCFVKKSKESSMNSVSCDIFNDL